MLAAVSSTIKKPSSTDSKACRAWLTTRPSTASPGE